MLLGSVVLALMLVVPFVVACAGPAPSPTPTPAPTPTPTPAPTPTPTPPPAEEVYEWRLQHFKAPGDAEYDGLQEFVNSVATMSDGRLKITHYPVGQVVPAMEILDATGQGVIEFGIGTPCYWQGKDSGFGPMWCMPFAMGSLELHSNFYNDTGFTDWARTVYADYGNYLLGFHPAGSFGDLMSAVPIYGFDDLKGLKVRTWGIMADVVEAAGASVVVVPGAEVYTALSQGVADACQYGSPGAFWALGLHEVVKYVTRPGWAYPAWGDAFINMDAWNELPDDLKEILLQANQVRAQLSQQRYSYDDIVVLKMMREDWGVTICQWDDEAIAEARAVALPLWDKKAAESPYAEEAVKRYRDYMRELGMLTD